MLPNGYLQLGFNYSIHISPVSFELILLLGVDRIMCRLPGIIISSVTTHFGKINEQQPIVLQCQVSESAPPFRHAHLLCQNLGFYLLLVFKWVIGLAGMSRNTHIGKTACQT